MGRVRGHEPFVIEEINGLWARGDDESCPSDHLLMAKNIQFIHSGIETRTATKPYTPAQFAASLRKTVRVYNYTAQWGQSLIVMVEGGTFYHVISATEVYQILQTPGATDFAMIAVAGRAYISPFKTYITTAGVDGTTQVYALGIKEECVYVYGSNTKPAGSVIGARPAAGNPPSNSSPTYPAGAKPFIAYVSTHDGKVTKGVHIITIANNHGVGIPNLTIVVNSPEGKMIQLDHIPLGATTRRIIMTTAIEPDKFIATPGYYNDKPIWYEVIAIPDNTTTTFTVDITDAELIGHGAYAPDATPATVTGSLVVQNTDRVGYCDPGFHLVAVVYETDTGYLTAPGPQFYAGNTYINEKRSVKISGIPISPDYFVKKRHIVSTKTIPEYNGDQKGYQFFFVPKGTLENNTATEIIVDYYDSDLIADASHLIDNFSRIPSCVNFCEYHGRMVIVGDAHHPKDSTGVEETTKSDNRSVAWLSAPGEPEAFNQIDGLIVTPLDGNPLSNCQDFRDVLYLFKLNRTYAVTDNQDEPSTWGPVEVLDQAIGAPIHGVSEVLDSGGVNVDYLIIGDWSGLLLFNGTYARPELSWKIENIWMQFNKNSFHKLQVINDSIRKKLWVLHPVALGIVLLGDYSNGLNPKDIRWALWDFEGANITSLALIRTDLMVMSTWQPDDYFNP